MKKLFIIALMTLINYAQAETKLVLPTAPGGVIHRYGMALQKSLSDALEDNVTLEFKAGAQGLVGAKFLQEQEEFTLLLGAGQKWKDAPINQLDDLKPLFFMGTIPGAVVCKSDKPYRTLVDVVNAGKTKQINYGIPGSSANLKLFSNISERTGTQWVQVPYKNGNQALTDAIGGHIEFAATVVDSVAPHVKAGTVTPLAIFAPKRSNVLPSVPTTVELGLSKAEDEIYYNNIFLWVNKNADPQKVERFTKRFKQYLNTEEGVKMMQNLDIQFYTTGDFEPTKVLIRIVK